MAFSLQEAIEQRRRVVARMRAAGLSTQRIAAATGAGRTTIIRDLKNVAHEVPERVVGVDGKSHPCKGHPSRHNNGG